MSEGWKGAMIRLTLILLAGLWLTMTLAGRPPEFAEMPVAAAEAASDRLALEDEAGALARAIAATQARRDAPLPQAQPAALETPVPRLGTVTGSRVNLRAGPTTADPVVGQVVRGARLTLLDEGDGWLLVERPTTGEKAWIFGRFVDPPG